ncbi:MAG: hypothetical protein ACC707_14835 [Thiohalomonadales bacterium]
MTNFKDRSMENKQNLLSDDDFISLMEAEFACKTVTNNEISKQKIWNNIQSAIYKRGIFDLRNPIYSIAATLLLVAIALPLVFLEFKSGIKDIDIGDTGMERTKGIESTVNVDLGVDLSVFTLDETGKLIHSNRQHEVGTTLVFKVHSTQNGVATIISAKNGNLRSSEFTFIITKTNSGKLINRKGQVYGYMIEPIDKILQFCIIAATDAKSLNNKLFDLQKTWAGLPANSCATINVTNSLQ